MTKQSIKIKKQDVWENRVKIAYEQQQLCKRNFNIFKNETANVIERYEKWLEREGMEPLINLNQYK